MGGHKGTRARRLKERLGATCGANLATCPQYRWWETLSDVVGKLYICAYRVQFANVVADISTPGSPVAIKKDTKVVSFSDSRKN